MKMQRQPTIEQTKRRIRRTLDAEFSSGKWLYIGTNADYHAMIRRLADRLASPSTARRTKAR